MEHSDGSNLGSLFTWVRFLRFRHGLATAPTFTLKAFVLVFDSTIRRGLVGLLVASVLEDHSSKCSTSYLQQLKQDLLSHEAGTELYCKSTSKLQDK